ncbi:MAG: ATP-binding protein [Bryobacteraceae bacterium]
MSFRTRLFLLFGLAVSATAILASMGISASATAAFERMEEERTEAIARQVRRELDRGSQEIVRRLDAIAGTEAFRAMAAELAAPGADAAPYLNEAERVAREQGLDFLEIIGADGAIISSAHYPARFGYKKPWVIEPADWRSRGAFVEFERLPEETAAGLIAVRPAGGLYLVGGERIDREMLDTLALPPSMTAQLYERGGYRGRKADRIVERVRGSGRTAVLTEGGFFETPTTINGIPLRGRTRESLAVLVLEARHAELFRLRWFIRAMGLLGALGGIVLGAGIAWWASARLAQPVRALVEGASRVAAGDWSVRVELPPGDEIGAVAESFNRMTAELAGQRERLVQAERVAAWRELARRLAHELKNPLFPLQLTVENLQRARLGDAAQFDEVFRESSSALLAEIDQLKTIVGRFSDFARMPAPSFETIRLAGFVPPILAAFQAQWSAPGKPRIEGAWKLADPELTVDADRDLLSRAIRNLILNAMDAMPNGGRIAIRAEAAGAAVAIEVADTGSGFTEEERARLFTPYYTTKKHGTGLGLAIVQSVVADHGGTIGVESRPGEGSRFRIAIPRYRDNGAPATG